MKGIAEIEFIISVFVFITTISFVTAIIASNVPIFHDTAVSESIKSQSYQYSELLLFDEGYPRNWSQLNEPQTNILRIGFSTGERYKFNISNFERLLSMWNAGSYPAIKALFGLDDDRDIRIEASRLDGTPLLGTSDIICEPSARTQLRPQFHTTRLGLIENTTEIIRMRVTIL